MKNLSPAIIKYQSPIVSYSERPHGAKAPIEIYIKFLHHWETFIKQLIMYDKVQKKHTSLMFVLLSFVFWNSP